VTSGDTEKGGGGRTRMWRFRRVAQRYVNPVVRPIARRLPTFGILTYRGRKSGRTYHTPINAFRRGDTYFFFLTYGSDVQWVKNVLAAGSCSLETRGRVVELAEPALITDPGLTPAPSVVRFVEGRIAGVTQYLRMRARTTPDVADQIDIRRAVSEEAEHLREIAIAAKGYWGYDEDRVRGWGASLDFSEEGFRGKEMYVAELGGRLVGWAGVIPKGDVCWLEDLWIEPASVGTGIGSRLFAYCAGRGASLGAERMEWEAEPNALGFYEKMGGRYLRDSEPNEWGRVLAIMGVDLADRNDA
jgi:deazaflavin-dependent oxidoreductase (nitroreductase family)